MAAIVHTVSPVSVGERVVLRYSLAGDGSAPWTDVLGELTGQDEQTLTVAGKHGPVQVGRAAVIAVKAIPPAPERRALRR